ncbi:Yip1-domain-containing protein [Wolfiporia cocos MD-104 SS10]|uniref:Protein YIP n=1 Tax=Wolfiporia cocos (strain MD-104) TaxID=742152 RepID=A0A2H3J1L4_WOLCO|nr:Yip1-domain-containing protein [Wolfiporia cocos MD-104 SS10]
MQRFDSDDITTPITSTSQFIQADDEDDLDEDAIPGFTHPTLASPQSADSAKGKGRAQEQLAAPSGAYPGTPVSGNIGGATSGGPKPARSTVGGVQVEMRYTGIDTLDEPVSTTIGRDLLSIWTKTVQVLYPPKAGHREVLRDWDLWGPLVICLALGILLTIRASPSQSLPIFTSVVCLMTFGSLIVTIQAKLLGGRVSFFQGLCVFGYCVAPLTIAALVAAFVRLIYVRAPVTLAAWMWCIWASVNFLDGTKLEKQRTLLAVYPLLLFYSILAWMIVIQ